MVKNAAINPKLKAKTVRARFLEPGLVAYTNETVLIKNENLMNVAKDFKGVHVIIDHQDIDDKNLEEIVGYVNNVWFENGWAWCDFTVNSEEAIKLIDLGYSVSCAYNPIYAEGGIYHNVEYDREIIGSEAIHMAIVENPRYEDAIIIQNSINKNKVINMFKIKKKEETKENSVDVELENAVFELDGEKIALSSMVDAYQNAKEEEKKENEEDKEVKVNADYEFEVDGDMVKVSELAKAFKASKKNEEEEEKKEAKKNEEEEKEKKENEEEEKKKEEAKEKQNSIDAKNANKIKAAKDKLENGVENPISTNSIVTDRVRFDRGSAIYGSPQKVVK